MYRVTRFLRVGYGTDTETTKPTAHIQVYTLNNIVSYVKKKQ